jgi:hypothetical protein
MKGSHVDHLLDEYIDGRLTAQQIERIKSHLIFCVACKQHLTDLKQNAAALKALAPAAPPKGLEARIVAAVLKDFETAPEREPERVVSAAPFAWTRWAGGMALAATCLLAVVVWNRFDSRTMKESQVPAQDAAEPQTEAPELSGDRDQAFRRAAPVPFENRMKAGSDRDGAAMDRKAGVQLSAPAASRSAATLDSAAPAVAAGDSLAKEKARFGDTLRQEKKQDEERYNDVAKAVPKEQAPAGVFEKSKPMAAKAEEGQAKSNGPSKTKSLANAETENGISHGAALGVGSFKPEPQRDDLDALSGSKNINAPPTAKDKNDFSAAMPAQTAAREAASSARQEWTGQFSGISEAVERVIETDAEWRAFWKRHVSNVNPAPATPAVDFSQSQVIAVFAGEKPSGGYAVSLSGPENSSWEGRPSRVFHYRVRHPAPGSGAAAALTQPFAIRVVPRFRGRTFIVRNP